MRSETIFPPYKLPVKSRIELKILVLTYQAIHGQAPSYLKELIFAYRPSRTLSFQVAGLLVIQRISKSRMGGGAFSYFKSGLKTFLFDKAYS